MASRSRGRTRALLCWAYESAEWPSKLEEARKVWSLTSWGSMSNAAPDLQFCRHKVTQLYHEEAHIRKFYIQKDRRAEALRRYRNAAASMSESLSALRELLGVDDSDGVPDDLFISSGQAPNTNAIDAFDNNLIFDNNFTFDNSLTFDNNLTFDDNFTFDDNPTFDNNLTFDLQAPVANMTSSTDETDDPDPALNYHTPSANESSQTSNTMQPMTAQPVIAQPVTAQPVTEQPVTEEPVTAPQTAEAHGTSSAGSPENTPSQPEPTQGLPTQASNASKLKRSLSRATGRNASGNMRFLAESDPENQEIVRLHQTEHLGWTQIADQLNQHRIAAGKEPRLTPNAVYSRYARNAPRIAAANGEVWEPATSAGVRSKRAKTAEEEDQQATPVDPGFDDAEDERLVMARHEIEEETWELVRKRVVEKGGRDHIAAMCARRYHFL
ncbi:hypothetical protein MMC07_004169 [Pseudocyphellaria aurata]|nr:hypothetical protein [Pseudocyphellaria aurata]